MIDSHCHLTDPRLHQQLDAVLSRAVAAGVSRMITIGTELEDDLKAIEVCRGRENLRCSIGVHPNYCHEVEFEKISILRELQKDPSVVALGEMGLDYHHNFADRTKQRKFFEAQLAMAKEFSKPVVIHCREAVDDTLAIMKNFASVPAVFHCFTGTVAEAERVLGAGYLLGFTGVVTFKKSDALREAVKLTPRDRLFVETDAPYLSPEPFRSQKINEPALVMHTATAIAQQWGVNVEEVDRVTTENVQRFFGWK
ncbi:MAG TPA: TatD family hydrolase [Tepidisphaeraceae bacterium]|nr:TatD family hydrolase [Tepidisphaeraceae bacterium]